MVAQLADFLTRKDVFDIQGVYGCGLGGIIAYSLLLNNNFTIKRMVIDGTIFSGARTKALHTFQTVRDYLAIMLIRSSNNALEKYFPPIRYGEHNLKIFQDSLKQMNHSTIWCISRELHRNYFPTKYTDANTSLIYWYGENEAQERTTDIKQLRKIYPKLHLRELPDCYHLEYIISKPQQAMSDLAALFAH